MKKYNFVCVQTIFNERMDTKKLRQKILDLAIHGKLVPQDPNDEPASPDFITFVRHHIAQNENQRVT